jgi:hypothetical protein
VKPKKKNWKMTTLCFKAIVNPAADLVKTWHDAIRLAKVLGVDVTFEFGGISCNASPYGTAEMGIVNTRLVLENPEKHLFKIACSIRYNATPPAP